jgi:hypothetical protein
MNKTEIIPIGMKTYREDIHITWKTSPDATSLLASIHIAQEK